MKKYLVLIVSIFMFTALQADYVLKYQMDTEEQTYMYHSDTQSKLTTGSGSDKSEIYKIGKKVYIVSYEGTKPTVMDLDEMKKMSQAFGGMDRSAYMEENKAPDYKIKKTGKKLVVGGVKGEVWIISGEEDGEKFSTEVVVSKDKKVAKAVKSMMETFTSMSGDVAEDNFLELQKGYVTIKADGMALKSFTSKSVPSSEYQLPSGAKKQQMPDLGKLKGTSADSCYEQVCCGNISAKSAVLKDALRDNFNGYKLVGSGVCDFMGLGSLLGINSVEGALFRKGSDNIQVTYNMDDKDGGILRKTKLNLDAGHSLGVVDSIKNYSDDKKVNGVPTIYGILMPLQQETLEYIIDSKTSLTISRLRKTGKEPSLYKVVSSGGVNLKKLQASAKSQKASKPQSEKKEDVNIDEAVNMLKSFF